MLKTIIIFLIIATSFFLFSTSFYPLVNSDQVLNVLIAHEYSLPHDVYCWDQDRGGTFIPFISQFFIKGFDMSPLLSVSISNYLILTLGFIGFSQLFKEQRSILLLAILWFFPYQRFIDINVFPIGLSYSLIGFSIFFIVRLNLKIHLLKNLKNLIYLGIIFCLWLAAVWVSDLIYVTLMVIGINGLFYAIFNKKSLEFDLKPIVFMYVLSMVSIALIIIKLKTYATSVTVAYSTINSLSEILLGLQIMLSQIAKVLLFKDHFFTSLGAWLILTLLLLLILDTFKNLKQYFQFKHFWLNFFLADFLAILLVILLSHWVLLNEMGRWYFVAPYISCALFFLLRIEQTAILNTRFKYLTIIAALLIIGVSSVTSIIAKYGKYEPMSTKISELEKLGNIGVIGNFWDAYRLSMVNPSKVKSTAYENGGIRNFSRVSEVFNQPKIILSRDMWLDQFPDSLNQFGIMLYKTGEPFYLAGSNLCEYTVKRETIILSLDKLSFDKTILDKSENLLKIDSTNPKLINTHIVYGPKTSLLPDQYLIKYFCSFNEKEIKALNGQIAIDISANHGVEMLLYKKLKSSDYNQKEGCFTVQLNTNRLNQFTEFRLFYSGEINFNFHQIEVIPLTKQR